MVVADDHLLFLEAIGTLLTQRGFAVVGLARDGEEAVRVARATRPDVVVLDALMPKRSGLDAARGLLNDTRLPAVVLVTGAANHDLVMEGMALGVHGFVDKAAAAVELFDAIQAAARGATYISPSYDATLRRALPATREAGRQALSPRERDVLRLITEGRTTAEIAQALGITRKTADTHRTRMMKKLDLHDIASLVRYAIQERMFSAS